MIMARDGSRKSLEVGGPSKELTNEIGETSITQECGLSSIFSYDLAHCVQCSQEHSNRRVIEA